MADRDYSCKLLLVEDNQNDLESTLAVLSEGGFIARDGEPLDYLHRRAVYRSQAGDDPEAGLLGLNDKSSSAAEREL